MKILVTSIVDLAASQHNRPHQFVRYLARNHDVTVLSVNDWWRRDHIYAHEDIAANNDFSSSVEHRYLTERRVSPILQEVLFRKARAELSRQDFDVQLNYNSLVTGYEVSKHINTVFDIADDLSAMIRASPQIPGALRPVGQALGAYYLRKQIARADHITLTCGGLKRLYNISDANSSVLPNGVDVDYFERASKEKPVIDLDGFIVGYVGVLREWVNFEPLFEALGRLDDEVTMLVVGGEGDFRKTVQLAKRCGVSDRVVFTGQVKYADVPRYINAMDVCTIPFNSSQIARSALPLKLFEYLACGKPVISSHLDAVKEVANGAVRYCSSADDYVETIGALRENAVLTRQLGTAGKSLIETQYTWEGICQKLESILTRVATKRDGKMASAPVETHHTLRESFERK